jgi:uncharacterized protein YndB with AHSA1/START domain
MEKTMLHIEASINAPIAHVWELWTRPEHITEWNAASDDWHTPYAENDLRIGGKFLSRMAARDGSFSFDFCGTYTDVVTHNLISYILEDERIVRTHFTELASGETKVETFFEPESENSHELQQGGWQAILNRFKTYAEA